MNNDGKLEVVVGSFDGKIYALHGENGTQFWNYTTGDKIFSSPAIGDLNNDGKLEVIFASNDRNVYTLHGKNGTLFWDYTTGHEIFSSPALGDINCDGDLEVVIGNNDGTIHAFHGENGTLLWDYTTGEEMRSSPTLGDVNGNGKLEVIIGCHDGNFYIFHGENGTKAWNYSTGNIIFTSPVLGDLNNDGNLNVVIANHDGNIFALKLNLTGQRIYWQGLSGDISFRRIKNQEYFDTDFDMLSNYSEQLYGTLSNDSDSDNDNLNDGIEISYYETNPSDPDSDDDELNDGDEITIYSTDPNNPDSEGDEMPDGWEIQYGLDPLIDDSNDDPDIDQLSNIDEYNNQTFPDDPDSDDDSILDGEECILGADGYITNATNPDSDYDNFADNVEINIQTDPIDRYWYPMPNLRIIDFEVNDIYEGKTLVLDFIIENNGIWRAENIIITITCEALGITLYDNSLNPIDPEINEQRHIIEESTQITNPGLYILTLTIDPDNLINETYSASDGGENALDESDNLEYTQMTIHVNFQEEPFPFWIQALIYGSLSGFASISIKILYDRHKHKKAGKKKNVEK